MFLSSETSTAPAWCSRHFHDGCAGWRAWATHSLPIRWTWKTVLGRVTVGSLLWRISQDAVFCCSKCCWCKFSYSTALFSQQSFNLFICETSFLFALNSFTCLKWGMFCLTGNPTESEPVRWGSTSHGGSACGSRHPFQQSNVSWPHNSNWYDH